jgi:hypothetical protein
MEEAGRRAQEAMSQWEAGLRAAEGGGRKAEVEGRVAWLESEIKREEAGMRAVRGRMGKGAPLEGLRRAGLWDGTLGDWREARNIDEAELSQKVGVFGILLVPLCSLFRVFRGALLTAAASMLGA